MNGQVNTIRSINCLLMIIIINALSHFGFQQVQENDYTLQKSGSFLPREKMSPSGKKNYLQVTNVVPRGE